MAIANQEGYTHIFWSLAFKDWIVDQQKGANYSYSEVMKQIHPGAIPCYIPYPRIMPKRLTRSLLI